MNHRPFATIVENLRATDESLIETMRALIERQRLLIAKQAGLIEKMLTRMDAETDWDFPVHQPEL